MATPLKARLEKAGIDIEELSPLLLKSPKNTSTMRWELYTAIMGGLAARWSFGGEGCTSPGRLARQAILLTDAAMDVYLSTPWLPTTERGS